MLNGFLESAHNQHRPLGKALSEPITVAAAPISGVSRQISEPVDAAPYSVRSPIAEEIEDDAENEETELVSDSEKLSKDETIEDIQLKNRDEHVMIVISAADGDDEGENGQDETENKPLLQRQDNVDNDYDLAANEDKNCNDKMV